ncbi:MAG: hypothetical protein ACLRZ2_01570 [Veillonella sp.]
MSGLCRCLREGGKGASIRKISPSDNRGAGSSIGRTRIFQIMQKLNLNSLDYRKVEIMFSDLLKLKNLSKEQQTKAISLSKNLAQRINRLEKANIII